jgi:glycosyltransferase involved in cell wall biosynthesis
MAEPLSVVVDIGRVIPGVSGGLAHVVVGLVGALGRLTDDSDRYVVVVRSDEQAEWIRRFIGPNMRLLVKPASGRRGGRLRETAGRAVRYLATRARGISAHWPRVPVSDGFYESLECDVIHFPHQDFEVCALPTVYNPHDLQHLHFPQFFTPAEVARRQVVYETGIKLARVVAVASEWIKGDVVRQYGVDGGKVQVIPWGAPTVAYPPPADHDLARVRTSYELAPPFLVYPARTWPHKNHLRLLEALADLRDGRGLVMKAVFTGTVYQPFWPHIERRVHELHLGEQVRFLGFVPEDDLRSIYRLAEFLVVPTLFESDSFPIYEAWFDGLPVACSSATALPDQVADAALVFEPNDVASIAEAIARLALDSGLRQDLRQRGHRRLRDFDWAWTAKAYRAVYRRAGGLPLGDEDRRLLAWDWMRHPRRAGTCHTVSSDIFPP